MKKLFISKEIDFLFYRFRHIIIYTFIGFFSIIFELIIRYALIQASISILLSTLIGLFCGILFAFILNIKFNFFVKKNFLFKALVYFFLISIFSFSLQFIIEQFTKIQLSYSYNYEFSRKLFDYAESFDKKVVYSSSAANTGDNGMPSNIYGWSKYVTENYGMAKVSNFVALRYFNVYGPGEEHKGKMASVAYQAYQKGEFKLFPKKPKI